MSQFVKILNQINMLNCICRYKYLLIFFFLLFQKMFLIDIFIGKYSNNFSIYINSIIRV